MERANILNIRSSITGIETTALKFEKGVDAKEYEEFLGVPVTISSRKESVILSYEISIGTIANVHAGEYLVKGFDRVVRFSAHSIWEIFEEVEPEKDVLTTVKDKVVVKAEVTDNQDETSTINITLSDGTVTSATFRKLPLGNTIADQLTISSGTTQIWKSEPLSDYLKYKRPDYYNNDKTNLDVIDVCQMLELDFPQGNVLKYMSRAGKKEGQSELKDLGKARNYFSRIVQEAEKRHGMTVEEALEKETEKRIENN